LDCSSQVRFERRVNKQFRVRFFKKQVKPMVQNRCGQYKKICVYSKLGLKLFRFGLYAVLPFSLHPLNKFITKQILVHLQ
jgi:hypothetical protein